MAMAARSDILSSPIVDLVYVLSLLRSENDLSASALEIGKVQPMISKACMFGKVSESQTPNVCSKLLGNLSFSLLFHRSCHRNNSFGSDAGKGMSFVQGLRCSLVLSRSSCESAIMMTGTSWKTQQHDCPGRIAHPAVETARLTAE